MGVKDDFFKIGRLFSFLFLVLGLLVATSCSKDKDGAEEVAIKIELDKESIVLQPQEQVVLRASGSGGAVLKDYNWTTDSPAVLEINDNEDWTVTIKGLKAGEGNVSIASKDGKLLASCRVTVQGIVGDGVLRILAIGNSFSEDALEEHLHGLAKAAGKEVVIGNLYIGGASLTTHWENADQNKAAYQYRKINRQGTRSNRANTSIETAILDEKWDYISLQQASSQAGRFVSYRPFLTDLADYVRSKATNSNMQLILHQVWAYAQHSTHSGFANYDNNQLTMYHAIVDAVDRVKEFVDVKIVVPAGTAIQNGRTSVLGDTFDRDGYHLNLGIGRYTASCTWFEVLFGESVVGNSYIPASLSAYEAEIAQHAAHFAILNPKQVTEMKEYQEGEAFEPLSSSLFVGFGYDNPIEGWNGLLGASAYKKGSVISNMKDMNGKSTGISLLITEGFNARNTNGEKTTNTSMNIPSAVSSNSFYGNAGLPWRDLEIKQSSFVISGLEKGKLYELCFFSSRSAVAASENRETKFIIEGENETILYLDAANNRTETTCTKLAKANQNGEITVKVTAGENNTNANGFFYINAMQLAPVEQ